MHAYIRQLKEELPSCFYDQQRPDVNAVMEILYQYFAENHPLETQEMARDFSQLDKVLSKLSLKEYDQIWNLACRLCAEHEKLAYMAGIRVGASLATELETDCV